MFKDFITSIMPQTGKSTKGGNILLDSQFETDNYFLTHDLEDVLEDFNAKAKNLGVVIDADLGNKDGSITKILKEKYEGKCDRAYTYTGLGNISQMKRVQDLTFASKLSGIKQQLFLDEIHKFALESDVKRQAQQDHWVKTIIQENFYDKLFMFSASAHDIIMAPYIEFDNVSIIKPYEGFKGFDDAQVHIRSKEYFINILEAYKNDKPPPNEFLDDFYLYNNALVNLHTKNEIQEWIVRHTQNSSVYNQKHKNLNDPYLVGGLGLSMSATFKQNVLFYFRKSGTHRALEWQNIGRTYGVQTPILFITQDCWDRMKNYRENMEKLINMDVLTLPAKERAKFAENLLWITPKSVCNPKLQRKTTSTTVHKEGNIKDCVEKYYSVYAGEELCSGKEWRGDNGAAAEKVKKIFMEQNPDVPILPTSNVKSIQDKDEVFKFRNGDRVADVRIGQDYDKPGRAYVIIREKEYKLPYSFFNYNGEILSSETSEQGHIYV